MPTATVAMPPHHQLPPVAVIYPYEDPAIAQMSQYHEGIHPSKPGGLVTIEELDPTTQQVVSHNVTFVQAGDPRFDDTQAFHIHGNQLHGHTHLQPHHASQQCHIYNPESSQVLHIPAFAPFSQQDHDQHSRATYANFAQSGKLAAMPSAKPPADNFVVMRHRKKRDQVKAACSKSQVKVVGQG
eukprot:jgi/Hompol1/7123/HPOL_002986-RA